MKFYCPSHVDAAALANRMHADLMAQDLGYAHAFMESATPQIVPHFNGRWYVPIPNSSVKALIQRKSA